ncbi:MAG: hypothetical protein ABH875_01350 [Candidatus Omnitrophota bacterium]
MPYRKLFIALSLAAFISILSYSPAYPLDLESKYFTANIDEGIDIYSFAQKIDIRYYMESDATASSRAPSKDAVLKDSLDGLYMAVSDVLGIHMYSLKINLTVLPVRKDINNTLKGYLEEGIDIPSYYFKERNAIYISFEDLTVGMLAHEIAHAIMARYFVIAPPPETQEILSGYVEFSINKSMQNNR